MNWLNDTGIASSAYKNDFPQNTNDTTVIVEGQQG
jgi:hypothetical protein